MKFSLKRVVCTLIITLGLIITSNSIFAATLLKVGSSGAEVSTLQQTLKSKGHYTYKVTGYYGSITKSAVTSFQNANGLTVDGIAGPQTLGRLYASKSSILKVGSSGTEVSTLQQKLKDTGYYTYKVTGYYGSITKNAVTSFQRANGLTVDGIAGPQTQSALYNGNNVASSNDTNLSEDIYWLSRIIEAESKGESYTGKVAVGNVVMNRVNSSEFPSTVKGVIFEYYKGIPMFSPVANGTIYNTPSQESINAAYAAYNGQKPVGNATYFFNPSIAKSSWISQNKTYVTSIGGHAFYV